MCSSPDRNHQTAKETELTQPSIQPLTGNEVNFALDNLSLDEARHVLAWVAGNNIELFRAAMREIDTPYYEVKETDIGQEKLRAFGRNWNFVEHVGPLQPGDVGKRVYRVDDGSAHGFLQIESDKQFMKRTGNDHGSRRAHHQL